jgi:general secretion pathway protein K
MSHLPSGSHEATAHRSLPNQSGAIRERHRGSALLLVVWAVIMLSAALLAWVNFMQVDLERSADSNREVEARAMARSGVAIGMHPLVSDKTPGLEEEVAPGQGFRVRMIGEGGKLGINALLAGEEPRKLDILKLWLESHGLTFQEREHLLDCLLDYVDGDNVKRLNGVEDDEGYVPANRPFQSIDEMEEVRGMEPLFKSPGWKDELTIYTTVIDLSAADEAILRLLPGLGEARIARFLAQRRGRDGVDGTEDDFQFKSVKEIQSYLGFTENQFKQLSGLVVHKDPTQRIISEGYSANVVRQIEVVVRKGGGANPAILFWKE